MLLRDKVALVTGSSRGIGKTIAEVFAAEGASLVLTARSDAVEEVAAGIRAKGGNAVGVKGDIADENTVRQCIQACRAAYSKLDILVNNAAAMPQAMIGMIALAEARKLFELNVISAINLTQFAARLMKAGGIHHQYLLNCPRGPDRCRSVFGHQRRADQLSLSQPPKSSRPEAFA